VDIASGDHSQGIFIGLLVSAALLGNALVLRSAAPTCRS